MQAPSPDAILKMPDPRIRRLKWIAVEFLYTATVTYLFCGVLFDYPAAPTRTTLSLGIAALTVGVILQIVNRKGSLWCRVPMAVLLTAHCLSIILLTKALY